MKDLQSAWDKMLSSMLKDSEGCTWVDMETLKDGRKLALVMGYQTGYDEGEEFQIKENGTVWTLCAKLAVNIDDLQCDYDVDWYMPYAKDGDVYDTEMAVTSKTDLDWYREQAKIIAKQLNEGTLEV